MESWTAAGEGMPPRLPVRDQSFSYLNSSLRSSAFSASLLCRSLRK